LPIYDTFLTVPAARRGVTPSDCLPSAAAVFWSAVIHRRFPFSHGLTVNRGPP
jgi:hypothetical protein